MNENKQLPGNQPQQQPQQPSALSTIFHALGTVSKWAIAGTVLFILLVCAVIYFTIRTVTATGADIEVDQRIGITPTQIASIKQIGQWEFLSVSDEEMVDTTRNRFFADDELVRIYYGTLRLGIDMNEVKNQWIKKEKDIPAHKIGKLWRSKIRNLLATNLTNSVAAHYWSDCKI